jgi:hypothetical protein
MKQLIIPKQYKELLIEKAQVEKEMRWFLVKKMPGIGNFNTLRDLANLKLKGGPSDLSSKLDNYIYA